MQIVSLFDAKTHLSRLVDQIVTVAESEILISRNGKPVARVVPIQTNVSQRIGVAAGEFEVPEDIDTHNPKWPLCFTAGAERTPAARHQIALQPQALTDLARPMQGRAGTCAPDIRI